MRRQFLINGIIHDGTVVNLKRFSKIVCQIYVIYVYHLLYVLFFHTSIPLDNCTPDQHMINFEGTVVRQKVVV